MQYIIVVHGLPELSLIDIRDVSVMHIKAGINAVASTQITWVFRRHFILLLKVVIVISLSRWETVLLVIWRFLARIHPVEVRRLVHRLVSQGSFVGITFLRFAYGYYTLDFPFLALLNIFFSSLECRGCWLRWSL